jgi:hypothetical protein
MRFPFWLVTLTPGENAADPGECGTKWLPLAFSNANKMAAYMAMRHDGQWEVRLVNRYSATEVFDELRERGCEAICFDVEGDLEKHRKIMISDAIAQLEKERIAKNLSG